jgi:hypothetical protein
MIADGKPAGAVGSTFTVKADGIVPPVNWTVVNGFPNAIAPEHAVKFVRRMLPNVSPGPPHDVVQGRVSV